VIRSHLALHLVAPPAPGPGVCHRCRGPARHGAAECWACRHVGAALGERGGDGPPVTALSLCRPGDALHGALRRYKDAPVVEARRHHARLLASLLDDFLAAGHDHLRVHTGGWQALSVVPSSCRAGAVTPFASVVDLVPALRSAPRVWLARGPERAGHLAPARDAFTVPRPLPGRRVLLLDDTWVTGSRARSAAASLVDAGMVPAGIVVIGRSVASHATPALGRWWQAHAGAPRRGGVLAGSPS